MPVLGDVKIVTSLFVDFFSSRRRHTIYWRDWSSDVCSSDLVIDGLGRLGVMGMTVPKEYGGGGFTHTAYCRVLERISAHCAGTAVLVGAHQSIGMKEIGRASCWERVEIPVDAGSLKKKKSSH